MIEFANDATARKMEETKAFAAQVGALDVLEKRLAYLDTYGQCDSTNPRETRCRLFSDFAPFSFSFLMETRPVGETAYRRWFNGGLIYSGPGVPANGSFPSLTVSGDEDERAGRGHSWGINT